MMAMTIFMGSTPAWARPAGAGLWAVSLAHSRAKPRFAGNAAATNQAPCQFAPPAVRAWKQEALAGGRGLAATFCQAPHKSGSRLINFQSAMPRTGATTAGSASRRSETDDLVSK